MASAYQTTSNSKSACCLCFCDQDIFSFGECNHPVCYECSTRMRVLCENCHCPICRLAIPQVLFTDDVGTYQDLRQKPNIMDKVHNIGLFCKSRRILEQFQCLLDIVCQYCKMTFETFDLLRDHVKRKHHRFFCDLCVKNLKIFPKERKSYNRNELARHRRKGDPDDTSHRGHPLCEFCDTRFLDQDELFKHLRRQHYFCHFCDTDEGANYFYGDYIALRDHFRLEHYLCEIGPCQNNPFVTAFRTKLDLKAHRANEHYQYLKGAAAKQMRTLDLEFSVAGGMQRNRSRYLRREDSPTLTEATPAPVQQPNVPSFDGSDFPMLCEAKPSDTQSFFSSNTMAQRVAKQNMFTVGSGAQESSKEDFPALACSSGGAASNPSNAKTKSTKMIKKKTLNLCINSQQDFPSLNSTNARNGNESLECRQPNPRITKVTSSRNITVQGNQSLTLSGIGASLLSSAPPEMPQTCQPNVTIIDKPSSVQKSNAQKPPQTDSAQDFPSLCATTKPTKKGKASSSVKIPLCNAWNREQQDLNACESLDTVENGRAEHNGGVKSKLTIGKLSDCTPTYDVSSLTQEMNSLTLQDKPEMGKYSPPSDYSERNGALMELVRQVADPEKYDSFLKASVDLVEGSVDAYQYYEICKGILGPVSFDAVFGELLVLLPDIRLQNVLMTVVGDRLEGISVCAKCQQVLARKDRYEHERSHRLEGNFPSLS